MTAEEGSQAPKVDETVTKAEQTGLVKLATPSLIRLIQQGKFCEQNGHWMEDKGEAGVVCRLCNLKAHWALVADGVQNAE